MIAAGGTAGHVRPALAVAEALRVLSDAPQRGAGQGDKDLVGLRSLREAGTGPRYRPVDSSQSLLELAADGTLYGIPMSMNAKSLVFYPKKAFKAKGYKVPTALAELRAEGLIASRQHRGQRARVADDVAGAA